VLAGSRFGRGPAAAGATDLGDGCTRLHATSLCDSFAARDGWLQSGMEVGVNEGYAKLDALLRDGAV
jgi:hypothetical protein